jgi:hypothetical protein
MWLRMCVALGVLSGLPVPTGDPLASLHGFVLDFLSGNPATWTAQPNPAWLPGGGLIGDGGLSITASMSFTPFALAARYGSERKRRLPPARERLAKHSGDGSREIVGTGLESGDEMRGK